MLKYLLVSLALFGAAIADDEWTPKTGEQIAEIRAQCVKEHPLSAEQMTRMREMDFPDEPVVRQYLLCSAIKLGIFCTKEGYHADRLAKQFKMDLTEDEALEIVKGCVDNNAEQSPTDVWAFRGHRCLMTSRIGDKVKAYIKFKREEALKAKASQA